MKKLFLTLILSLCLITALFSSPLDWMKDINGSKKLSTISIPGTHDSATQYVSLSYIFRCQDISIREQLDNGYRYLDMRLVLKGDDIILKHNFAACKETSSLFSKALTLDDVLIDVYAFLVQNPTETVIMCMKAENGKDDLSTLRVLLDKRIEAQKEKWYLENVIPTLDEVRGKIVLATRIKGDDRGLNFRWIEQGDRTVLEVPHAKSSINETSSLYVQDRYNFDTIDKINAIKYSLENCLASDDTFYLNFTSTSGSGKVGHPKKYSDSINKYMLTYPLKARTSYGIIIVDFATRDLAKKIYNTNF